MIYAIIVERQYDVIICFFSFWTEINALFANARNTYSTMYNMRVEENYDF